MPNSTSDVSVLGFGSDSPLFSKKKTAKKKVVIPKKKKPKVDPLNGNSPLFVDKKPVAKRRGPKSHALIEEEKIIAENKRVAKKQATRQKKLPKKKGKVYPKVTSPKNCKHILPASKKYLTDKWKLLESGTLTESSSVASYINGMMTVCKEKRPKEYEELYVLRLIAKRIYNDRTQTV